MSLGAFFILVVGSLVIIIGCVLCVHCCYFCRCCCMSESCCLSQLSVCASERTSERASGGRDRKYGQIRPCPEFCILFYGTMRFTYFFSLVVVVALFHFCFCKFFCCYCYYYYYYSVVKCCLFHVCMRVSASARRAMSVAPTAFHCMYPFLLHFCDF